MCTNDEVRDDIRAMGEAMQLQSVMVREELAIVIESQGDIKKEVEQIKKDVSFYNGLKRDAEGAAKVARILLKWSLPIIAVLTFVLAFGKKIGAYIYSTITCHFP